MRLVLGPQQQFAHPCPGFVPWPCRLQHTPRAVTTTLVLQLCCTLRLPLDMSTVVCPPLFQIVLVVILFYLTWECDSLSSTRVAGRGNSESHTDTLSVSADRSYSLVRNDWWGIPWWSNG